MDVIGNKIKIMRIGIIGCNPFCNNRGVNALAYSTLEVLRLVLGDLSKHDISFLEPHFHGEKKKIYLGEKILEIKLNPLLTRSYKQLAKLFLKRKIWEESHKKFDIIFDISGGDSFADIYGQNRYNEVSGSKKIYRKLSQKQIFLPQTIGPFSYIANENDAIELMKKADFVFARDSKSFSLLQKYKVHNSLELIDMAFFLPYSKYVLGEGINVGINVSALLWNGGYTGNNQFSLKVNYQKLIHETIDFFLVQDVNVHLIPHVLGTYWFDVENDYAICKKLIQEYGCGRLVLAPYSFDPCEIKSYISGLDFFTGARMHACIAAFSSDVPVCPMSYSRKFTGLFGDTLGYSHIANMNEQDTEMAFNAIKDCYLNVTKADIQCINESIVKVRKTQLIEAIKDIL